MKIPLYWIEKFKLQSLDVDDPLAIGQRMEMIKEIQNDAYNSALKDVHTYTGKWLGFLIRW